MAKVDYYILRLESGNFLACDQIPAIETNELFHARYFDYKHQALDEKKKHSFSDVLLITARIVQEWA